MRAVSAVLFLFMLLALVPAMPAMAQELGPILGRKPKEKALQESQQFYNDCIKNPIIDLSAITDQAFCACSAANLEQWLLSPSSESGTADFLGAPAKKLDKNTLITEIYGSCLHLPVYELTYRQCITDDRQAFYMNTQRQFKQLCQCIATGDESYFRQFAKPYLEMVISAKDKDIDNPIEVIKKSTDFYSAHFDLETNCHQDVQD